MAAKKVRTEEQKRIDTDKRIQKKFGITLLDRETMAREQDYKCKICDGPIDAHGYPCVDHFHFYTDAILQPDQKMIAIGLKWCAQAYDEQRRVILTKNAKTKAAALADVKKEAMPWHPRNLVWQV